MKRKAIKFSGDYPKLHGQTSAELIAVRDIRIGAAWGRDVNEGEFFVYPREDIIDIVSPAPTLAEILAKLPAAINGVGVLELALDDRAENNAG